ncbi:DUF6630 family protein [Oerskovia flava]|uniref:DUF6630 family protein n=1 Tax=Oerskovia flava TaxID=2986422 RepID=UPI00223F9502|nr:hypothetical protein [Oerskovia sp. JB1-3-2]
MTGTSDRERLWERLCGLLDDDPELWPAVRLALTDPARYATERAAALPSGAAEDADDGVPVDVWSALLDGLDDAGALVYLDAADAGAELVAALGAAPRVVRAGVGLDPLLDDGTDLFGSLAHADLLLSAAGLALVLLEEDSDAYPLVVVPARAVDEVVALALELGGAAHPVR